MDIASEPEIAAIQRAQRNVLRSARLRLKNAFLAARKEDWTDEKVNELYPYPFYTVDPKKRTVTVANAIRIRVRANGQILLQFLKPIGSRKIDHVSWVVGHYHQQIHDSYRNTVGELFYKDSTDLEKIPPQYHGLVPMIHDVLDLMPVREGYNNRATLLRWIDRSCPFWPARVAGIHKIAAIGKLVRIEVSRLIEAMPVFSEIKRSFNWTRMIQDLNISAWNRFASIAPYFVELKKDNKRLATPYMLAHFWDWLKLGGDPAQLAALLAIPPREAVSWWRAKLIEAGLTPAAWRWLTHLPPPQLCSLVTAGEIGKGHVALLNYVVARQVPAQHSICFLKKNRYAQLFSEFDPADHRVARLLEALVRERNAGLKKWTGEKRGDYQDTLSNALSDIFDFFQTRAPHQDVPSIEELAKAEAVWPLPAYEQDGENLVVPRGVGLKWFIQKSSEWHLRMQPVWNERTLIGNAVLGQRRAQLKWDSALQTCEIGEYSIIPLTNAIELGEEGAAMHHCVAGYSYVCMDSGHRIFSIRSGEVRAATLEIYPPNSAGGEWRIAQVRGKRNAPVSPEITDIAKQIARRYSKASAQVGSPRGRGGNLVDAHY